ncbi:MAG: hypothetical protein JSV42_07515 [Chloroflexota bacterium]|nr:MAG: hypothetical protein JSV42_07515 [Chloroflexota bacterium]
MKKLVILGLVIMIAMLATVPAFAHEAPPFCHDFNEDGKVNGQDMADFHKGLQLGQGGHKPGVMHRGFSVCDPSSN